MTIEDDRQAIADLVRRERFHRDRRRWDDLADDYVEDSRVKTTWFEGTGREFAAASREVAQRGRESRAYAIAQKGYEIAQDELGDDRPDLLEPFSAAAERLLAGDP
jgi:hypothetical protein